MNSFFIRLLTLIAVELREIAAQNTDFESEEFDILFDASDAVEEAHDLLTEMLDQ